MTLVEYSETIKKSLEEFCKQEKKVVTPELNSIIENISKTGITCYPWTILKELFYFKLNEILDIFEKEYIAVSSVSSSTTTTTTANTSSSSSTNSPQSPQSPQLNVNIKDEEMQKIKNQVNLSGLIKMKKEFLDSFKESKLSPFTVQRLCELIINYKMYTSFSKYLCAVEKMLNVSTLPHLTPEEVTEFNKNQNSGSRLNSSPTSTTTTTTTTTTTSPSTPNEKENNYQPNLDSFAFSSSFTTSFPSTAAADESASSSSSSTSPTKSTTLSTDQEMKDVEQKDDTENNESESK
ncbi:hypothetical protein RB653_010445 [Dictyostelium firmibasis]|uniref:Serine/threonine-protein phosphatase 4 regulatory subunit 2 n=1 Tax=Dictyostelium firmibasis TaxID=79012 RepID=A0AAN7TLK2_9MYCE